jgi:hypothetical protein
MILNGDVRFGFDKTPTSCEGRGQHQEPDIVKKGGELERMQRACIQGHGSPDHECDGGRASTMASLPGEGAIDLLADLTNQDTLDIPPGRFGNSQTVDLLEQVLDLKNGRTTLMGDTELHTTPPKVKSPRPLL